MTLVFGKLYTFYSTKVVVLGALAVFEVGSVICGAATSSLALIIGRSIAGLGSAGILSGTMQVIVEIAPLEQRPICASLVTGLYGVASVTGPLLGGAFTDYLTWRWCFYINLPIGAVTIFFIVLMFKTNKPPQPRGSLKEQIIQMDLLGLFFFLPGTICLLLALQWGGTQYPLADGRVIGLFVTAGALLLIFIAIQSWRKDQATIPPRLISNRNIWAAACFAFFFSASYMVFVYYVRITFQNDSSYFS
jgi:MFS family permease